MGYGVARTMSAAPGIHLEGTYALNGHHLFGPVAVDFPAGQWSCLLGRSGIGKSTLLRLVAGLKCPGEFDGQIHLEDGEQDIGSLSAFMDQSGLLLPWLSVVENVLLGPRLRNETANLPRAEELLVRVGLKEHRHKKPFELSGGMRQRVALARTLLEDRPIALLDEPFSALDASTRAEMQELAAETLSRKTVILITHEPSEAVRLGHQIFLLEPGGMTQWETPGSVPIRPPFDPSSVRCQATLLEHLRGST